MKRLVIDTNVYTAFKRGVRNVVELLKRADVILVPATVAGELLCGFKCGKRARANLEEFALFLATPRVRVVEIDGVTAEIYRDPRGAGRPIPTNDMWIAASTKQHDGVLCTLDAHFRDVPGLAVHVP